MNATPLDVAIASCLVLPEPDPDEAPLTEALRSEGLSVETLGWDDASADFSRARVTLLRSTWNYPEAPEAFASFIDRTAKSTALYNGAPTVHWNLHKRYLLALERAGVPVVPTRLIERGASTTLASIMHDLGTERAVVKPAISAASRGTIKVDAGDLARGEAHLRALAVKEDVLVQPYLSSVEGHGERAVVWIDGAVTHAVRKSPRFAGGAESVSTAVDVAPDEIALAERAIAVAPGPLLIARIDVARGDDGRPMVMELELIEPSLYFVQSPTALARYVAAVQRRLA
jgi:hypothetical protein